MKAEALSVKELAIYIKNSLEDAFKNISVQGEAISVTRHTSGHLYFSLKEDGTTIDCIAWRSAKLKFEPKEGAQIMCKGYLTTYPDRSKYQIIVKDIQYYGIGELLRVIEERKMKLKAEGLFDNKKPMPKFPQIIGIVTSPTGAVIHDMMHRINQRYPCQVLLYPINVQGEKMVGDAIRGIQYLQNQSCIDLIILARGGGSFDDLFGFNNEDLVRAVAACKKPIISAIGHETDTTLCDYASDLRAPTPTAAIELCTPDKKIILQKIEEYGKSVKYSMSRIIKNFSNRLDFQKFYSVDRLLSNSYQRLDYLYASIRHRMISLLKNLQNQIYSLRLIPPNVKQWIVRLDQNRVIIRHILQNQIIQMKNSLRETDKSLKALSHKETLKRGYCRAYTKSGSIDTQNKAKIAKNFIIEFKDGTANVSIEEYDSCI